MLDLGLPDLDGLEVVRRIRSWREVPVIVLSATALEDRKVAALDAGANDYVTKPFGMAELEARIRTALRHAAPPAAPEDGMLGVGPDRARPRALPGHVDGEPVELTAKEFELLAFLARHAGKTCTHQMVLRQVWGDSYGDEAEYLRVYIYRLRKKLGEKGGLCCARRPASVTAFQPAERCPAPPAPLFIHTASEPGSHPVHAGGHNLSAWLISSQCSASSLFALAMLGLDLGLGAGMTAAKAILLGGVRPGVHLPGRRHVQAREVLDGLLPGPSSSWWSPWGSPGGTWVRTWPPCSRAASTSWAGPSGPSTGCSAPAPRTSRPGSATPAPW